MSVFGAVRRALLPLGSASLVHSQLELRTRRQPAAARAKGAREESSAGGEVATCRGIALCGGLLVVLSSMWACNNGGGGGGGGTLSSDADLADLLTSAGVLTPAFDVNTTSYAVNTTGSTSSTIVTATTSDAHATLEINGQATTSGAASGPIALSTGTFSIDVVVTAQDGVTTKTYTIIVSGQTITTELAASPSAEIQVGGPWLVYLADELQNGPSGTDLNGDLDFDDDVAVVVNLISGTEQVLGVATRSAVILGDELYLMVEEGADNVDWSGTNGLADVVLLHWSGTAGGAPTFVDVLDLHFPEELPVAVGTRLFYAAVPAGPLGTDETNLRMIDSLAPTTPVTVLNQIGGGALHAHLYGAHEGLIFAFVDENDDGVVLNGDGDATDEHVLALLDGTRASERMKVVGLALESDSEPLAAHSLGANDWLAAFLVDEASQGVSLNNQNLLDGGNPVFTQPILPNNCAAVVDLDTTDQVLHYLKFASFLAGTTDPVNTGLVGHDRVIADTGFVATLSDEAAASCNLNAATGDADTNDDVLRWVATTLPNAPEVDGTLLHAIADATSGGSLGIAVLDARLVAVVDEAADDADYDTQAGEISADHDLIAWLDPALANPVWHFSHQSATRSIGTGIFDSNDKSEPFAGTGWMGPEAVNGRLPLVFLEEVPGATNPNVGSLNTNLDCNLVVKDNDKSDGLPVWADFEAGPTLDFDGMGYAVDKANAGIEIAGGFVFFRVSENNDNEDYNGDGQTNDVVLFRNPLTSCGPFLLGTSSELPGPVITTDGVQGVAFLSDESLADVDYNGDGDSGDMVVRYSLF